MTDKDQQIQTQVSQMFYATAVSNNSHHVYDAKNILHDVCLTTTGTQKNIHTSVAYRGRSTRFNVSSGIKQLRITEIVGHVEGVGIITNGDLEIIAIDCGVITISAEQPNTTLRLILTEAGGYDIYLKGYYAEVYISDIHNQDYCDITVSGNIGHLEIDSDASYNINGFADSTISTIPTIGTITCKNYRIHDCISTVR